MILIYHKKLSKLYQFTSQFGLLYVYDGYGPGLWKRLIVNVELTAWKVCLCQKPCPEENILLPSQKI